MLGVKEVKGWAQLEHRVNARDAASNSPLPSSYTQLGFEVVDRHHPHRLQMILNLSSV